MEGFGLLGTLVVLNLKFNEGDLEVSVKLTVFPEILMLPCRVNNRIKGLFYVLSFVVELNRRLSRLKLVWKASGLGLAYTFVRLSFVLRNANRSEYCSFYTPHLLVRIQTCVSICVPQGKVHLELRLSEVITDSGVINHKLATR